jgi:hypothetical protein
MLENLMRLLMSLHLHCSFAAEYHVSIGVASIHWRGALHLCLTVACRGESMTSAGLFRALNSSSLPTASRFRAGFESTGDENDKEIF